MAIRMSGATIGYLLSVFVAGVTLAFVVPGSEPVPLAIPILGGIAIGLAAVASLLLVLFVKDPWPILFGLFEEMEPGVFVHAEETKETEEKD